MAAHDAMARIRDNPKYQELKRKRNVYGWTLTIIMLAAYYGYILVIAFSKETLAAKLGSGVTTWGIPIGIGLIVFTIVLTGIYVRRANGEFDAISEEIVR